MGGASPHLPPPHPSPPISRPHRPNHNTGKMGRYPLPPLVHLKTRLQQGEDGKICIGLLVCSLSFVSLSVHPSIHSSNSSPGWWFIYFFFLSLFMSFLLFLPFYPPILPSLCLPFLPSFMYFKHQLKCELDLQHVMRSTLLLKDLDLVRHYPGHNFHQVRMNQRMRLHEVLLKQRITSQTQNYSLIPNLIS